MLLQHIKFRSQHLWFFKNLIANSALNLRNQTIIPNDKFYPWKMTSPCILKHTSFFIKSPRFLLSRWFKRIWGFHSKTYVALRIIIWTCTSFCFNSNAFKSAIRSSLTWTRSNMGHWFSARIWLSIEKQLELEMFRHLKRRSHCSTKPYTICGTPMQ